MKLPNFVTQPEFEKILAKTKYKHHKLAYLLAFEAGMRLSEIAGLPAKDGSWRIKPLQPSQIDLQGHQIRIIGGKGLKDRIVPLPKRVTVSALSLLPIECGRRALQKAFKKVSFEVLGRTVSFHGLRHGFANYLVNEKNMPLPQVQILLGHNDLSTTGIYLHANPKQATESARELFS